MVGSRPWRPTSVKAFSAARRGNGRGVRPVGVDRPPHMVDGALPI